MGIKKEIRIEFWKIINYLHGSKGLYGIVHNHPRVPDGHHISTSSIQEINWEHLTARTRNNTYKLVMWKYGEQEDPIDIFLKNSNNELNIKKKLREISLSFVNLFSDEEDLHLYWEDKNKNLCYKKIVISNINEIFNIFSEEVAKNV